MVVVALRVHPQAVHSGVAVQPKTGTDVVVGAEQVGANADLDGDGGRGRLAPMAD